MTKPLTFEQLKSYRRTKRAGTKFVKSILSHSKKHAGVVFIGIADTEHGKVQHFIAKIYAGHHRHFLEIFDALVRNVEKDHPAQIAAGVTVAEDSKS